MLIVIDEYEGDDVGDIGEKRKEKGQEDWHEAQSDQDERGQRGM